MTTDDTSLALAAANGDQSAFATLAERHYRRVYALAFRLTGVADHAEDLTQDVYAALPTKLRSFRGNAQFTTWLYRVVVNAAHDRRRRTAAHQKAADGWGDWELNRRAALRDEAERADWLTEALSTLSPDLRDTVALLTDSDLTQSQAAEVLGVSPGTVAWRVSEIKKHLRKLSAEEMSK